jgi:hypothetical protein
MQPRAGDATCVFCGKAIGPDEPASGRPPMAAHAACADAALADDRHWDAVAGADPAPDEQGPPQAPPDAKGRSTGCLMLAAIAPVALLALSTLLLGG